MEFKFQWDLNTSKLCIKHLVVKSQERFLKDCQRDSKSQMEVNVTGGFTVPAVKFMEPVGIGNVQLTWPKRRF